MDGLPLDSRREAGAAAATQAGGSYRADDAGRTHRVGTLPAGKPAMGDEIFYRERVDNAAASERRSLLLTQVGNMVCWSEREGMVAAG